MSALDDLSARAPATRVICLGLSAFDRVWNVVEGSSGGGQKVRAGEHHAEGDDLAAGLARVAGYGCRVAAVTCGAAGVAWLAGRAAHRCAAFPAAVVDTTGAGDVFHGAYALATGAGLAVADAMTVASAAAALKCTRPGGRSGIPTLPDTLALARTL